MKFPGWGTATLIDKRAQCHAGVGLSSYPLRVEKPET